MGRFGRNAAGRLRHVQHLVCILFGREARGGTAVFPGYRTGSLRNAICLSRLMRYRWDYGFPRPTPPKAERRCDRYAETLY